MSHDAARRALARLTRWLLRDAYPLWAERGWDRTRGGFYERVAADQPIATDARRARVQLRQIYSFARARELGWQGDSRGLVTAGLAYLFEHYLRPDGLVRTLVAPDGSVADDRALLYDQAFALLALAEAYRFLGAGSGLQQVAQELLDRIRSQLARSGPGFRSDAASERPLSANPHMHLLEAALAWRSQSGDPRWERLTRELVALALDCLVDPRTGAVREHCDLPDVAHDEINGRIIEPGHQYEWAWLLMRARGQANDVRRVPASLTNTAARIVEIGESYGVRDGVAVNALLDDLTIHDARARLWPQTERLKAHARMAWLTGEPRHWLLAAQAAQALERYLETGVRGLWYDSRLSDGRFVREPSPASSFYHIVCAIGELGAVLAL